MDVRPELHARLDDLMAQFERTKSGLVDLQRTLQELTATARSDDGLVSATVGPRGELLELELDPRIYRRPNSKELASKIVQVVGEAAAQVSAEVEELVKPYADPAQVREQQNFDFGAMFKRFDAMVEREDPMAGGRYG